jgi:hypothetical protein
MLLTSCGPPAKVRVGYDKHTNFKEYSSFFFNYEHSVIAAAKLEKNELFEAVKSSLFKKGLRYDSSGGLLITVKVFDVDKEKLVETTFYPEYARAEKHTEGYISGRLSLESRSVDEFIEEWCIISVFSKVEQKIIWEAGYVARRDYGSENKYRHKQILEAVRYVVRKYPA